jgi:hypothetical protein
MVELDELEVRIKKLEKKQEGRWRMFVQYLLSPILLLVIGSLLTWMTNAKFEKLREIETTKEMFDELFSIDPERALIADRLVKELLNEATLAYKISETVGLYQSRKVYENALREGDPEYLEKMMVMAKNIKGDGADKFFDELDALNNKEYFIVVNSTPNLFDAKKLADDLCDEGYSSEVYRSLVGLYAVTIGKFLFGEALDEKSKFMLSDRMSEHGLKKPYIIPDETRLVEKIHPESAE